jgi:hypothetical protein
VECHREKALEEPQRFSDLLERCDACHDADFARILDKFTPVRQGSGRVAQNGH